MGVDKSYNPLVPPRFKPKKFMEIIYGWQENCAWNANYLENHDQRRSITRFGDPKKYWKESGKMLATLNLTLHGTPFIYQGEEIGMLDLPRPETYEEYKDVCCTRIFHVAKGYKIFSKKFIEKFINQLNRDHARTPMQWDDSPNAGFSSTQGETWLPVNPNYKEINAKKEAEDPDSILAYYKKLLRLRKEEEALIDGTFESIKTKHPVYQYFRKLDGQCLLIVLNFSGKEAALEKDFAGRKGKVLLSNVGRTDFEFVNKLKPFEAAIIKL
jgi:oligo-1,6-glucosidase